VIIDGDMDEVPSQAASAAVLVAMNAVPYLAEAAEFLDVEMQEIAGSGMFVALNGSRRLQIAEAIEFESPQDTADGSRAEPGVSGDTATGPALAAQVFYLLHKLQGGGFTQVMGTRTAVPEVGGISLIATDPLAGGLGADFELGCSRVRMDN
jgi:hypothetical protein